MSCPGAEFSAARRHSATKACERDSTTGGLDGVSPCLRFSGELEVSQTDLNYTRAFGDFLGRGQHGQGHSTLGYVVVVGGGSARGLPSSRHRRCLRSEHGRWRFRPLATVCQGAR
ncbi:hypothetical protein TNCV_2864031 [Trichonephila clavipes]|nr:hypothetical protein TNCV_2864031 [Trichonephila clavipes]